MQKWIPRKVHHKSDCFTWWKNDGSYRLNNLEWFVQVVVQVVVQVGSEWLSRWILKHFEWIQLIVTEQNVDVHIAQTNYLSSLMAV